MGRRAGWRYARPAQQPAESRRTASHDDFDGTENVQELQRLAARCENVPIFRVGDTGREHLAKPAGNPHISSKRGTESGTLGDDSAPRPIKADPDLASVIAAWPNLPEAIRTGIVAMVKAAKSPG
jgi:hypothetical protein